MFTDRLTKRRASESVFGYITLLPSGYRYIALHKKNSVGESPLQKYVLGEEGGLYHLEFLP